MEIKELLAASIAHHASDLHLLPNSPPLMRINGELIKLDLPALTAADTKSILYGLLSEEQRERFESLLSIDLALNFPGIGIFRVNVLHQLHGIAGVLRVIPEEIPSFNELGLPTVLKRLLVLKQGLVLVSGATGSGKSTTLATMIDLINQTRAKHIITIEDPIEFIYTNKLCAINQLQVGRDARSMADALRSALRQDPNIILLGEMRDLETIRLALTAAETGHLVMTTLHAGTAPVAISRIVDAFPNEEQNKVRHLLAETVQAVICQTLVSNIEGGRTAAFEVMLSTAGIRHMIRQDKIAHMSMAIQTSSDVGMFTIEQYLEKLVNKRIITLAEARKVFANRGVIL